MKILLLEHEPIVRLDIKNTLERENIKVDIISQAVDYDFIIIGQRFVKQKFSFHEYNKENTTFIFLYADYEQEKRLTAEGYFCFNIEKPFASEIIIEVMREINKIKLF